MNRSCHALDLAAAAHRRRMSVGLKSTDPLRIRMLSSARWFLAEARRQRLLVRETGERS